MSVIGFFGGPRVSPSEGARSGDEGREAAGLRPWCRQAHARQGGPHRREEEEAGRWRGLGRRCRTE